MRLLMFPQWDKLSALLRTMARQSAADYCQRNIVRLEPKGGREQLDDRRVHRGLIRVTNAPDLAKQGWRSNAVEVSGSGLRPEGVLVYDERSQGRVAGPTAKVSQPRQIGRTLVSRDTPPHSPARR